MKNFTIKRAFSVLLALAMIVTSLSIQGETAYAASKTIKSISLKIDSKNVTKKTFKMTKGKSKQLKVIVKPTSSKKSVTYQSKNKKVVTVSKKGKLIAKKVGTAKIIVKVKDKKRKSKQTWVKIKVSKKKKQASADNNVDIGEDNNTVNTDSPKDDNNDNANTNVSNNDQDMTISDNNINTNIPISNVSTGGNTGGGSWSGGNISPSTPDTPNKPNTPDTPNKPNTPDTPSTPNIPEKEIVVDTIEKLLTALKEQPSKIVYKTDADVSVEIPDKEFSKTTLVVDARNATITNLAKFAKVEIKAIKSDTWIEKATGNIIDIVAKEAHIVVSGGAIAAIQVNAGSEKVTIENESGTINNIDVSAKAEVIIEGNSSNAITLNIGETAKDASISTMLPLNVTAQAAIELQFRNGSQEGSEIAISNIAAKPTIIAPVIGSIPVKNQQTGNLEDVIVVMPDMDSDDFKEMMLATPGAITGKVVKTTNSSSVAVSNAAVYIIPYVRGVLDNDLDVAIAAAEEQDKCYVVNTSAEGEYKVENIPYGNYVIIIKADGLQTYFQTIILDQALKINEEVRMTEHSDETGNVRGTLYDAQSGNPIENALKLYLRSGASTVIGDPIKIIQTDENGSYAFEDLSVGTYTIQVVDDRANADDGHYISVTFNVIVLANTTIIQDMTITKAITDDQLRFVLRWEKESELIPSDLDSHLVGPDATGDDKFHVYFSDRSYYEDGVKYADLDVDDTDWEGPETTTVYQKVDGVYHFYVYDYSDQDDENNIKLAASRAKVDVYFGSRLLTTYNVPDAIGTLWDVCTYDTTSNVLKPINQVYYHPGYSENVGLLSIDEMKERLSALIAQYDENIVERFGEAVKDDVQAKLEEAKIVQETSTDFSEVITCISSLSQYFKKLMDSTEIEDVNFTGKKRCQINRHYEYGEYSVINLTGDTSELPADLEFIFKSGNTTYEIKDSDKEWYKKVIIVTNSDTHVVEKYYLEYQEYVPDFEPDEIEAENNSSISWNSSSDEDSNGQIINVLSVKGNALVLINPVFYSDNDDVQYSYEALENNENYVGKLTAAYKTKSKVYFIQYSPKMIPSGVKDGDNYISDWDTDYDYIDDERVDYIYISGAASTLLNPELTFDVEGIQSTYEPLTDNEGFVGKFVITYGTFSKIYFVKYSREIPTVTLKGVSEEGNIFDDIDYNWVEDENGEEYKVYELYGYKAVLGSNASLDDVTFKFNVVPSNIEVVRASSTSSVWDFKLNVTYMDEVQTVYLKYTQNVDINPRYAYYFNEEDYELDMYVDSSENKVVLECSEFTYWNTLRFEGRYEGVSYIVTTETDGSHFVSVKIGNTELYKYAIVLSE